MGRIDGLAVNCVSFLSGSLKYAPEIWAVVDVCEMRGLLLGFATDIFLTWRSRRCAQVASFISRYPLWCPLLCRQSRAMVCGELLL